MSDESPIAPAPVTVVVGGPDTLRAALLDEHGVVTAVVLLPTDWHEQDPDTRYAPGPSLAVVILDDDALAVPGARFIDGEWIPPRPPAAQAPVEQPSPPAPGEDLAGLVAALRALTPDQAVELQQLLAHSGPPS